MMCIRILPSDIHPNRSHMLYMHGGAKSLKTAIRALKSQNNFWPRGATRGSEILIHIWRSTPPKCCNIFEIDCSSKCCKNIFNILPDPYSHAGMSHGAMRGTHCSSAPRRRSRPDTVTVLGHRSSGAAVPVWSDSERPCSKGELLPVI